MGKIILSPIEGSAISLIILIGAQLLQVGLCDRRKSDCSNEVYQKLDNPEVDFEQAEEILLKVDVKVRNKTLIGSASVAELLKLKEPCDLDVWKKADIHSYLYSFSRPSFYLHNEDLGCSQTRNAGALEFFDHYQPIWEASCTEKLHSLYAESLRILSEDEMTMLQSISMKSVWRRHKSLQREANRLIHKYKSDDKAKTLFKSACCKLTVVALPVAYDIKLDQFTKEWWFRRRLCEFCSI